MNLTEQSFIPQGEMKDRTQKFTTKEMVTMALFAAVLCVSAYLSIPLPNGTRITFLNFVITLIALVFPASQSFLIILVWMLLGAVGLPVFVGGSAGIGYLFSAWGGYHLSFLIVAFALPLLCGKEYHRIRFTILAILSAVFVDLAGTFQLMFVQGLRIEQAILPGFFSFIVLDLVKAVVAAWVAPVFRRVLQELSN